MSKELEELLRKQRELCAKYAKVDEDWYRGRYRSSYVNITSILNAPAPELPAATPATGQGMKWVKASERIPIDGVYFSRYDEEDSLFTVLNNGKPYKISFASGQTYRGGLIDLNKLVWLDQSPQPDKEPESQRGPKCVAGCKNFSHYETKHHKDCPFYSGSLSEQYDKLRQWKKDALYVMPDFQELAKLMGVPVGESVHDKIIPYIKKLQNGKNLNQNT
jgi:hypothetical protein